MLHFFY